MDAVTIFGLALAPLYAAIAEVESDDGKASMNVYQIDEDGSGYIQDVNRILAPLCRRTGVTYRPFPDIAKYDRRSSERMMFIYWQHWGEHYERKTGRPVTYEVLARIHNGGPLGWKKNVTFGYWHKVESVMARQAKEGGVK